MPWPSVLAYYLAAFSLLVWPRRKVSAALALSGALVWGAAAGFAWARAPALRVVFLHLPRAQAALVTFSGSRRWLIFSGGPAGVITKALRFYGVERLEKAVLISPEAEKPLKRIAECVAIGEVARAPSGGLPELCEGRVCFGFAPPRVRRGNAEFSIIPSRLRQNALDVATDGSKVEIGDAP